MGTGVAVLVAVPEDESLGIDTGVADTVAVGTGNCVGSGVGLCPVGPGGLGTFGAVETTAVGGLSLSTGAAPPQAAMHITATRAIPDNLKWSVTRVIPTFNSPKRILTQYRASPLLRKYRLASFN